MVILITVVTPCGFDVDTRVSGKQTISIFRDEVKMETACLSETLVSNLLQVHTALQRRRSVLNVGSYEHACRAETTREPPF
jgi:hypothetical protein